MNESGKAVLWNRNFIQCCVSYFLMNFAYYMLMPTLPIYLVEELRMGTSEVGWVLSIYTIGVLCVRPFSGYLVDCFSMPYYRWVIGAYVLSVASVVPLNTYILFCAEHYGMGVENFGKINGLVFLLAFFIYGLTINLAMSLAPLVAVGLHERQGFPWIVGVAFAAAALGVGSVGLIRYPKREKVPRPALSWDRFILLKALPAALSYALVAIPYGMLLSFVVLYGREIDVPAPGFFFIYLAIGVGTARLISGRLVDHGKIHAVSIVSLIFLAVSFAVFACVHTPFIYFACALAIGIGFGVSVPAFQCLFVNVAPHQLRGTATSTYLTSFDLGMGIGMLSAGFIATHVNLATAYGVGSICCLLSLFVYLRWVRASYDRDKLIG